MTLECKGSDAAQKHKPQLPARTQIKHACHANLLGKQCPKRFNTHTSAQSPTRLAAKRKPCQLAPAVTMTRHVLIATRTSLMSTSYALLHSSSHLNSCTEPQSHTAARQLQPLTAAQQLQSHTAAQQRQSLAAAQQIHHSLLHSSSNHTLLHSSSNHTLLPSTSNHSLLHSSSNHSQLHNSSNHSQLPNSSSRSKLPSSSNHSLLHSSSSHSLLPSSSNHSQLPSSSSHSQLPSSPPTQVPLQIALGPLKHGIACDSISPKTNHI